MALAVCEPAVLSPAVDISEHRGLIRKLAHRYRRWAAHIGMPFEDFEAEVALALHRAALEFDPDRGSSFANFAYLSVPHDLQRLLKKKRLEMDSLTRADGSQEEPIDWRRGGDPDQEAQAREWVDMLPVLLAELNDDERRAVEMRFGLVNGSECVLGEIGTELDVTREGARYILGRALDKMRGLLDG